MWSVIFWSSEQEGTRLKADYELTWDKVGFFRNSRRASDHRDDGYRNETAGYSTDDLRRKRFRVCMLLWSCNYKILNPDKDVSHVLNLFIGRSKTLRWGLKTNFGSDLYFRFIFLKLRILSCVLYAGWLSFILWLKYITPNFVKYSHLWNSEETHFFNYIHPSFWLVLVVLGNQPYV